MHSRVCTCCSSPAAKQTKSVCSRGAVGQLEGSAYLLHAKAAERSEVSARPRKMEGARSAWHAKTGALLLFHRRRVRELTGAACAHEEGRGGASRTTDTTWSSP